jgi:4-alpha-glucanotransferase
MRRRGCGILLHITCLPGPYGIGDLGPQARAFADFLHDAGQNLWQILPLSPTEPGAGDSPYSSPSAFAGNPLLISPEDLALDGYLTRREIGGPPGFPSERIDFDAVREWKEKLLDKAFKRFGKKLRNDLDYQAFCEENAYWLDDYALFTAIRADQGASFEKWPAPLRDRDPDALAEARETFAEQVDRESFRQFLFHGQWRRLRDHCTKRGVHIMGDAPIYVAYDSADVWANTEIFKLNRQRKPSYVAGVPPDYFSATGQRWGNPVYDWERLHQRGFDWWLDRIRRNMELYDLVRIDHFRAFAAYWEVPARNRTAMKGEWIDVPGYAFFDACLARFVYLPIVAEDLGYITDDVHALRDAFGMPGMRVLQFGFYDNSAESRDAPHNVDWNSVVYTGTHDNEPVRSWFANMKKADRKRVADYLGRELAEEDAPWALIHTAYASAGRLVVAPLQDVLALGQESRMNTPSTTKGNWLWRFREELLDPAVAKRLRRLAEVTGRR